MRRFPVAAVAVLIAVAGTVPALAEVSIPGAFQILGNVTDAARPVANALVIALDLTSFDTIQTFTAADGRFSLPPLRSGIYKIIAVKNGFAPAVTTVIPSGHDQRVNLRLRSDKKANKSTDQIWEIRGSLPPDVLREIDMILEAPRVASYEVPRLKGEMLSMTGMTVARQADGPAFAQTGIGVQSRIGEKWQLGIRGDMQRFEDPTDSETFGNPVAASSAMSMELRPSTVDAWKFSSTRSTWRYNDPGVANRPADLRSHNLEWEHGAARVKVRYFAHENFFRPAFGSDVIEVAGDTPLLQTRRNDLGVSLRVRQESVRTTSSDTLRTADIAANGTVQIVPAFIVHYGMASRLALDRAEWAPSTGAEWKISKSTALIGSVAYKVVDSSPAARLLPSLVAWTDGGQVLPRYSYSFGIVSSRDENNRLSAMATVTAADSPLRVIISDGTQQFWDTLAVDRGDVQRDVKLAYRHDFGSRFAVDVSTVAGTATPRQFSRDSQKTYMTGDLQTIFTPTRTTLAVSYREISQPAAHDQYRSSRVNVRMAQSLYLPIDMKLLVGVELVHAENSPFLLDTLLPEETSRKYIGGLAVNF